MLFNVIQILPIIPEQCLRFARVAYDQKKTRKGKWQKTSIEFTFVQKMDLPADEM